MEGIPQELVIVGGIGLVILAALIVARWGKQILTALLVAVGVVIVGLIAWALLQRPDVIPDDTAETIGDVADIARALSPEDEPEPAQPVYSAPAQPTYTAPAPIFNCWGSFLTGVLTVLVILSLGVGGYFGLRWKLAELRGQRPAATRRRPRREQGQPIVYVIEADQGDDLADLWDLEGLTEWTEGDFFQL